LGKGKPSYHLNRAEGPGRGCRIKKSWGIGVPREKEKERLLVLRLGGGGRLIPTLRNNRKGGYSPAMGKNKGAINCGER